MEEIDLVRQLVELAVTSGRSHQSPQTNFVQYCHQSQDEGVNHTIPVYENVLFALALIRMQTVADVNEAKEIIGKIVGFQNLETGNFPTYIHEYPVCRDHYVCVHLLAPLYWVLKGFKKVLGKELIDQITTSMKLSLDYCSKDENFEKAPFQIAIKIAAANVVYGKLWKDKKRQERGKKWMEELRQVSEADDFGTWYSPVYIAETLIALQMVYEKISKSPWTKFWKMLSQTWFQPARCYIGPPVKLLQWRSEPQPTLYDLYLGDFTGGYPYHSFIDHPFQLQGALVRSIEDQLEEPKMPFKVEGDVAGHTWCVKQTESYGYSVIDSGAMLPPELKEGFHHFRMVWGDENRIHSFSCQGGFFTSMTHEEVDGGVDLSFVLAEDIELLDRKKGQELCFFLDQHEGLDITVNDKKATTFNFNNKIRFKSDQMDFTMKFIFEDGDARMMGHIQPGNRASQVDLKGDNRFKAFDWEIFLRTVRRYTSCQIKVEIRI
ncbi:MAG: hypothetical protein K940chlam3_01567 [Chlamydiae bacterium]|nr:hypothetical protein [Chlamydiota bacterium]